MLEAKLRWINISPRTHIALCVVGTGKIVGYARLKGNRWAGGYYGDMAPSVGNYSTDAEAKAAVEQRVRASPNVPVIMEEDSILTETYEIALRNIIARKDDAVSIARKVLADPTGWLEELRER